MVEPINRLANAFSKGRGLRLTADEVFDLIQSDDALMRAVNDLLSEEACEYGGHEFYRNGRHSAYCYVCGEHG